MILLKPADVWAINDGMREFLRRVASRDTPMPDIQRFIHGFVRSEVRARYAGNFEVHVFLRKNKRGYDIDWHLTDPVKRDPDVFRQELGDDA